MAAKRRKRLSAAEPGSQRSFDHGFHGFERPGPAFRRLLRGWIGYEERPSENTSAPAPFFICCSPPFASPHSRGLAIALLARPPTPASPLRLLGPVAPLQCVICEIRGPRPGCSSAGPDLSGSSRKVAVKSCVQKQEVVPLQYKRAFDFDFASNLSCRKDHGFHGLRG